MKQIVKKIIIVLFLFIVPFIITSCGDKEKEQKGYDGRIFDISYNNDESVLATITQSGYNYELEISGSGKVKSYNSKDEVPWNVISKRIVKVTIKEGITNIGDYYFYSIPIDSYIIPSSVKSIEVNSFNSSAEIYSYSEEPIDKECSNNIYYYSETNKTGSNYYWHMVGNLPVIWRKYKLLFIGNSFTFYPNKVENPCVVSVVKSLADDLGLNIEVDFVVKGAHTLKKFADAKDEQGMIVDQKLKAASDYDYVILQEQSTTPVNGYNNFKQGVEALLKKVNDTQKDCEVVLYATWGFPDGLNNSTFTTVPVMEGLIRDAYVRCADELDLSVSHVGEAFTYVYEKHPSINLYWTDNKHQGYAGAYLSACVHICTLFNIDVRNATFNGELSAEEASILRNVAYEIVLK